MNGVDRLMKAVLAFVLLAAAAPPLQALEIPLDPEEETESLRKEIDRLRALEAELCMNLSAIEKGEPCRVECPGEGESPERLQAILEEEKAKLAQLEDKRRRKKGGAEGGREEPDPAEKADGAPKGTGEPTEVPLPGGDGGGPVLPDATRLVESKFPWAGWMCYQQARMFEEKKKFREALSWYRVLSRRGGESPWAQQASLAIDFVVEREAVDSCCADIKTFLESLKRQGYVRKEEDAHGSTKKDLHRGK